MRRALLLIVAFIVYGTLYPWHFNFSREGGPFEVLSQSWPAEWDRGSVRDAVENVLLYIPLGAAAALAIVGGRARWRALAAPIVGGFALSGTMELLQVWIPGRDPSLADVVFNTVGAAAGAIAAIVLRPWLQGVAKRRNPQSSAAILLLGCWIAYQLFPFLPELRPYRLYHEYRTLLHTQSISVVAVWANAAEWMAAAVALQAIVPRSSARWAPAVIGLLAMRVFTPERTVSAEEISGAAAFLLLWFAIRERLRRGAALWMMISSVTLRELEPFRWAAAPAGFSWVPFRASFLSDIQSGVTMVLRKAFDYGGVVWLLVQARVRYRWAAAMTAAALLALELVQRYLPGRTPEITDAALAAIMAVALWTAART